MRLEKLQPSGPPMGRLPSGSPPCPSADGSRWCSRWASPRCHRRRRHLPPPRQHRGARERAARGPPTPAPTPSPSGRPAAARGTARSRHAATAALPAASVLRPLPSAAGGYCTRSVLVLAWAGRAGRGDPRGTPPAARAAEGPRHCLAPTCSDAVAGLCTRARAGRAREGALRAPRGVDQISAVAVGDRGAAWFLSRARARGGDDVARVAVRGGAPRRRRRPRSRVHRRRHDGAAPRRRRAHGRAGQAPGRPPRARAPAARAGARRHRGGPRRRWRRTSPTRAIASASCEHARAASSGSPRSAASSRASRTRCATRSPG